MNVPTTNEIAAPATAMAIKSTHAQMKSDRPSSGMAQCCGAMASACMGAAPSAPISTIAAGNAVIAQPMMRRMAKPTVTTVSVVPRTIVHNMGRARK